MIVTQVRFARRQPQHGIFTKEAFVMSRVSYAMLVHLPFSRGTSLDSHKRSLARNVFSSAYIA
jgi:hypothetical protein